jgi:hypothetical protein
MLPTHVGQRSKQQRLRKEILRNQGASWKQKKG